MIYSKNKIENELTQKSTEIETLEETSDRQKNEISELEFKLSESNNSLRDCQSELYRKRSFSSKTYFNGILTENFNNIEDAYDACKQRVSELESELRRYKNGW